MERRCDGVEKDYLMGIIDSEKTLCEKIIANYKRELSESPEGCISQKERNGKKYYYQNVKVNESSEFASPYRQILIPNYDLSLAKKLIRKQFLKESLKALNANLKQINKFDSKYLPCYPIDVLSKMKVNFEGAIEIAFDKSEAVSKWINEPYEKNPYFSDKLYQSTSKGVRVRSKSEALIGNVLESNNIPYKYEAKFQTLTGKYYPDFTILKPKDGRILIWEHFGMMNNEEYVAKMNRKNSDYFATGLVLWSDYIFSCETETSGIDTQTIQAIINAFIL
ncbi:MAG: hypothetical protein WCQ41_02310 [Bacillota bacterium]